MYIISFKPPTILWYKYYLSFTDEETKAKIKELIYTTTEYTFWLKFSPLSR